MKKPETDHTPEILMEWQASPLADIDKVLPPRSFYAQIGDPEKIPPRIMRPGERLRQTPESRLENFMTCRTAPEVFPTKFLSLRHEREIGADGEFIYIHPGDTIEITNEVQALRLWRQGLIRPEEPEEVAEK
jgi:hypothetical protein